jgi:hypothetical protein
MVFESTTDIFGSKIGNRWQYEICTCLAKGRSIKFPVSAASRTFEIVALWPTYMVNPLNSSVVRKFPK